MTFDRVGKRVRVYWSEEREWFDGSISEYEEARGYFVKYDDGDERWEPTDQTMKIENEEIDGVDRDEAPEMMEPPPLSPGSNDDNNHEDVEQSTTPPPDDTREQDVCEDSESEISGAESELPQTFGKNSIDLTDHQDSFGTSHHLRSVPVKGFLNGRVLRASGLQSTKGLAPTAFVRVSFVELGNVTHENAMLRCKETLLVTDIVENSRNPVWNEKPLTLLDKEGSHDSTSDVFQLELLPRVVSPASTPLWNSLPGHVFFTVFSTSNSDSSARNRTNEHIGQATFSLRTLVQDLVTISPCKTLSLELQSRSGRRLDTECDDCTEVPKLVVSFQFTPIYPAPSKQTIPPSVSTVSTTSSLAAQAKNSSQTSARQKKNQSTKLSARAKTSSSFLNRRKFEKKVAKENGSLAKRMEWNKTRPSHQFKGLEAKKGAIRHHRDGKHRHKTSSEINRHKSSQQIAMENKAMDKRLQKIVGRDQSARKTNTWVPAEPKDSVNHKYIDRDKVHLLAKRRQQHMELDSHMRAAQKKYQEQSKIMNEVMELQETVAALRNQVDKLKKSVNHFEIVNEKDRHVRDYLFRAATKGGESKTCKNFDNNERERVQKSPKQDERKLLEQHRDRFRADKEKLDALHQQELDLDTEIREYQSKWKFAIAAQCFQRKKEKKNVLQEGMKNKQRALDLSREDDEQWECYQAHQELTQLQLAIRMLQNQSEKADLDRLPTVEASSSSSSAICDYLTEKVDDRKVKLHALQNEVESLRNEYQTIIVNGDSKRLRKRVQELQKLVLLSKTQESNMKRTSLKH